jgi:RNA-binding protein
MTNQDLRQRAHNTDVTVWVGKAGVDSVVGELNDQLAQRDLVKAKFHRSARGDDDTAALAAGLAERVNAEVIDVRGHTAVFHR